MLDRYNECISAVAAPIRLSKSCFISLSLVSKNPNTITPTLKAGALRQPLQISTHWRSWHDEGNTTTSCAKRWDVIMWSLNQTQRKSGSSPYWWVGFQSCLSSFGLLTLTPTHATFQPTPTTPFVGGEPTGGWIHVAHSARPPLNY